jgi:hypothetical protein
MSKYHVTTKRTKGHEGLGTFTFQFLNFVLFASFVVIFIFVGLRLRRTRLNALAASMEIR